MFVKSFDGTKIFYTTSKKSDLFLIFLHGWGNNWTTWKKEIKYFQQRGYSTLAVDLRGHGQSDKPEGKQKYRLECFAKDVHKIILREKIKQCVLIGHSMGGMIALTFYKLFNRDTHKIKALVLTDTTARNIFQEHKVINSISPFIKYVLDFVIKNRKINKEHFKHLQDIDLNKYRESSDYFVFLKGLHNTPLECVFACLEAMMKYDAKKILNTIEPPVLVIEGEKDRLLPKLDSFELYEEIKSAEICIVPDCGHFANIQSPRHVNRYILQFLQKHKLVV